MDDQAYIVLQDIFTKKKWPARFHVEHGDLFDELAEFLSALPDDDDLINLSIDIIREYEVFLDYFRYAQSIAHKISQKFSKKDDLIVVPVRDENGNEIKSGDSVCYVVKSQLNPKNFKSLVFKTHIAEQDLDGKSPSVIVIDDFIGTGSQFRKFSKRLRTEFPLSKDNIYVYCIAAMSSRLERVQLHCNEINAEYILDPVLAKLAKSKNDATIYDKYDSIEQLVSVRRHYFRGYSKTEAAVSLYRTPNNTLPIFWETRKKGGGKWPAPFPRY